jgi:hydrogenase expression/formation protein HypE
VLAAMRNHPLGRESAIIGTVTDKHPSMVTMKTAFGTTRIVDMLPGDQLPPHLLKFRPLCVIT